MICPVFAEDVHKTHRTSKALLEAVKQNISAEESAGKYGLG